MIAQTQRAWQGNGFLPVHAIYLFWGGFGTIWACITTILFWICFVPPVFSHVMQTAVVETEAADFAGRTLRVARSFCIDRDITVAIQAEFRDGLVFQLPDLHASYAMGCHTAIINLQVPSSLPAGHYLYRMTMEYDINPMRRGRTEFPDIDLELEAGTVKVIRR
jgi:hypothetical protein